MLYYVNKRSKTREIRFLSNVRKIHETHGDLNIFFFDCKYNNKEKTNYKVKTKYKEKNIFVNKS